MGDIVSLSNVIERVIAPLEKKSGNTDTANTAASAWCWKHGTVLREEEEREQPYGGDLRD